jgi:hypothetical protein
MTETMPFPPGLSPVGGKTIAATFDGGTLSSNGGTLPVSSKRCTQITTTLALIP